MFLVRRQIYVLTYSVLHVRSRGLCNSLGCFSHAKNIFDWHWRWQWHSDDRQRDCDCLRGSERHTTTNEHRSEPNRVSRQLYRTTVCLWGNDTGTARCRVWFVWSAALWSKRRNVASERQNSSIVASEHRISCVPPASQRRPAAEPWWQLSQCVLLYSSNAGTETNPIG